MNESERYENKTHFQTIYDSFLSLVTDDMYMEWGEEETYEDLKNIFLSAISSFQFPRFRLYDYEKLLVNVETGEIVVEEELDTDSKHESEFDPEDIDTGFTMNPEVEFGKPETRSEIGNFFNFELTREEVNIFSHLMMVEWVNRQLASVDVTRQAYSSRDFEFTSQANHLDKLMKLKESFVKESTKLQRLYTRRKMDGNGYLKPNYRGFGGKNNAN